MYADPIPRPTAVLGWSWRVGTFRGIEYRLSLFLLIMLLFNAVACIHARRFELIPLAIFTPLLAIFLHFCGHLLALRLVRARARSTIFSVFGDITDFEGLALRWWPQFIAPASGILLSAALWYLSGLADHLLSGDSGLEAFSPPAFSIYPQPVFSMARWYHFFCEMLGDWSCSIMLWNLLPILGFDGARMWRIVFWPVLGLNRSVRWCIVAGLICAGLITILAVSFMNILLLALGVVLLLTAIAEFRSMQGGFDLVLQLEPSSHDRNRNGIWGRWAAIRERQRQDHEDREIAGEQEILDKLLAKVGEGGLPALSARERATLAQISKRQQQRQG